MTAGPVFETRVLAWPRDLSAELYASSSEYDYSDRRLQKKKKQERKQIAELILSEN